MVLNMDLACFLHINKNAGTTIRCILQQNYPEGVFLDVMLQGRRGADGRPKTVDGLDDVFAVNALAPYLLTALIKRPRRLVYLTSGLHQGGDPDLRDLPWRQRRWSGSQA